MIKVSLIYYVGVRLGNLGKLGRYSRLIGKQYTNIYELYVRVFNEVGVLK